MGVTIVIIIGIVTIIFLSFWIYLKQTKLSKRKQKVLEKIAITLTIVGGGFTIITGCIALYDFFILHPREQKKQEKLIEDKLEGMVSVPSPLQDGVTEFVPKDEFEFGVLTEKADSAFHIDNFLEADSLYTQAYDFVKDSRKGELIALALYGIGAAKGMLKDYDKAIKKFVQSLKYKKELKDYIFISEIHYNLGVSYQLTERLDNAIKNYNKAIELNPKLAQAFNNRGTAYADKGESDKAMADYNRAIELNPKYNMAFYNRGGTYADRGEFDKAIADYKKTVELNPKFAHAMAMLGITYEMKKNKEKAKFWYEQVLKYKDQLTDLQIQEVQNWLKELDKQ
jgi:tetratricopeptide (TPR) repeat protein